MKGAHPPTHPRTQPISFLPPASHLTENVHQVVMKPEISALSADAVFLPMADLSDDHAMHVDFHGMADTVANNLRRMKVPVEEQAGIMKQLWSEMVDDMFGGQGKKVVRV